VEHPVSARTGLRHAALALGGLAVLILAGSLLLYALTRQNLAENGGQDLVIFSTFVTVGLVVTWHRPGQIPSAGSSWPALTSRGWPRSARSGPYWLSPTCRSRRRASSTRFNRAGYDADRTIEAFAARLQDPVDQAAVQADLAVPCSGRLNPPASRSGRATAANTRAITWHIS
jgi:hypothetical protein